MKIINAILGLDAETRKRAVISIITYVTDALYIFGGIEVPDEKVNMIIKGTLGLLTALVWCWGFYKNENYTPEGCEGTGYTRVLKAAADAEPEQFLEEEDYRQLLNDGGDDDEL